MKENKWELAVQDAQKAAKIDPTYFKVLRPSKLVPAVYFNFIRRHIIALG
jgi:hypothetical protein